MDVQQAYYAQDSENPQDMMSEKGNPQAEQQEGEGQSVSIQVSQQQVQQAAQLLQQQDFEGLGRMFASLLGAGSQ